MTVYYVTNTGNDLNDGLTELTAWQTIQKAADTMTAGDKVLVKGNFFDQTNITKSGSVGFPIKFIGLEYPSISNVNRAFNVNANNIEISGFDITALDYGIYAIGEYYNFTNNKINETATNWGIYIVGGNYSTVSGNTVYSRYGCITFDYLGTYAFTNIKINNNYVGTSAGNVPGGEAGSTAIGLGARNTDATNITISDNIVVGSGWNGIGTARYKNCYIGHNIVDGGVKYPIQHNGINIHNIRDSIVEYNIVRNTQNASYSKAYYLESETTTTYGLIFRNNESYNVLESGFYLSTAGDSYILNYKHNLSKYPSYGIIFTDEHYTTLQKSGNITVENAEIQNATYSLTFDSVDGEYYIINSRIINSKFSDFMFDRSYQEPTCSVHIFNSPTENMIWYPGTAGGNVIFYYYLDVLVKDNEGTPVPDAYVTITNITNPLYPAKNLKVPTGYLYVPPDNILLTKTMLTGHTPLPQDRLNTIVLPRYNKTSSSQENFMFEIKAEYSGYSSSIEIQADATWYRADPNMPTNTIEITLPFVYCPIPICDFSITPI